MVHWWAQVTNLKVNGHRKRTFAFMMISIFSSKFYIFEVLETVLGLEILSQIQGQGQGLGLHYQSQGLQLLGQGHSMTEEFVTIPSRD